MKHTSIKTLLTFGLFALLFSFLFVACSKEESNIKKSKLDTVGTANWGSDDDCPFCLPTQDLIKRVNNQGANVVLGTVDVCRTETDLCFTYKAKAGSEIGSIKIGLFASYDDLFATNNNPAPKNFIVVENISPKLATVTKCIPVTEILTLLGITEQQLYDPANASKLYITAEAQISGSQEGGQAWAGTRVGNGKYPFDRYFIYQFAGCNTPPTSSCTYTQGFWKTHGYAPKGNNVNEWDSNTIINGMQLGGKTYTAAELQSIFDTPVGGNGLISLAHQLIAAKLNVANGADATAVSASIAAADALIASLIIPPVGSGYLAPKKTGALTTALGNYNEGITGPGHCE
nr:hypothetical protein [uncultured organism]